MKRFLVTLLTGGLVLASLVGHAAAMPDQQDRPPTIFLFTSNVPSVTMDDLEAGDLTITLGWHVAHVDPSNTLRLYAYQGYSWTLLHDPDQGLPAVGNLTVPLEHPGNFGSPTYKLVLLDVRGVTLDERTLVIPFDREAMDGLTPVIESFVADTQSIDAAALAGGTRVVVTWRVTDRLPQTNLVFEQVIDDQVRNIELPRDRLWVPSVGTGAVVPVQPPNSSVITLQLRVLDVITAHVYAEQTLTISVTGSAIPPTAEPETEAQPDTSDAASSAQAGDLVISTTCLASPGTATQRGWVDGDGIRSPDQEYIAYATNSLGDAKLVIAQANGSGQIVIEAPDKAFPIGTRPVWSPDSQRIAFANIALSQPGGGTIYVVAQDGSDLRDIAPYVGYHDDLAWSEDGTQLYFSSGVASGAGSGMQVGDYSVYEVTADGLGAPFLVSPGCADRP